MTDAQELKSLLAEQSLDQDSSELDDLRDYRDEIEKHIRDHFPNTKMVIKYGGSYAKGTMIREAYDLDLVVYVASEDNSLGDTLEDIYNNVYQCLADNYSCSEKTSAIRITPDDVDFHIDVVPGRFVEGNTGDVFLYQKSAEKCRLKTNLKVHIDHIKNSGVTDALKLMKLMRIRKDLEIKQFALDMLVVDLLKKKIDVPIEDKILYVLERISDLEDAPSIEDPANPQGNDISSLLSKEKWEDLQEASSQMIDDISNIGWDTAFTNEESISGLEKQIYISTGLNDTENMSTKPWQNP